MTVVGTVKRDLRSVEETIADMRKAKEAKKAEAQAKAGPGAIPVQRAGHDAHH